MPDRLRGWFARFRRESRLDEELQFHLERLAEQLEAQGLPHREAVRRARVEIGGTAQIREQARDQRGFNWFEDIVRDSVLALRNFRKSPGFALAAIFTLAL